MSAYDRAHYRVKKLWGKASQYSCIRCGGPARDWAYDHTDPANDKYSMWPEFYMPMCHACHLGYDRSGELIELVEEIAPPGTLRCHYYGCENLNFKAGCCLLHYYRKQRHHGTPGPPGRMGRAAPLEDRFINNVQVNGPIPEHAPQLGACSIWTGYVHQSGFGIIGDSGKKMLVHRVAWERVYGPLPHAALLKQICGNRLCVRVDHLKRIC